MSSKISVASARREIERCGYGFTVKIKNKLVELIPHKNGRVIRVTEKFHNKEELSGFFYEDAPINFLLALGKKARKLNGNVKA